MRLLILTPQVPFPPHQGTTIRNWGLLGQLAQRHTLDLLTFGDPAAPVPAPLAQRCARIRVIAPPSRSATRRLIDLALGHADLARRLWSPAFRDALNEMLAAENYAGVQVEGLELAAYLPMLVARRLPIVFDAHNAEHVIQERALATDRGRPGRRLAALYSRIQLPRLKALERTVCAAADGLSVVSAEDARALQTLAPSVHPIVIPNGITLGDYEPVSPAAVKSGRVVFTGKMDYRPNVDAVAWFVAEIWPRVRTRFPAATFWIVGQAPTRAVRALSGRDGVHVTGAVDDTRPHIAGAQVYVTPLRMGGGTRFKILEAFALGRPVVSTHIGAEGFSLTNGREALLADTPLAFAEAVCRVIEEPDLETRLGAAGRTFVATHYDWAAIGPRLNGLWDDVLGRRM